MRNTVPEKIETKRLTLRQFKEKDWKDMHGFYSDEIATKYTFGCALTEGESWRTVATLVGHWQLRGYGPYALELNNLNKVIGTVGFWYPCEWPEPEIKWNLVRKYWGHGYASEAVRAVQNIAKKCFPNTPLISFMDSRNSAAINLARAVGAIFEKKLEFRGGIWHVYRHPK